MVVKNVIQYANATDIWLRANLIGKLNSKTTHFDSESDENNISDSRLGPDYADSNSIIKRYKMPINYAVCTEPDGTKPIEAANVQQPPFFYKKKKTPKNAFATWSFWRNEMERTLGGVPHMPMDEKRSCGTTSLIIMTVSRHLGPKPARSNRRCGMRVIALAFFFFVRLCRIDDKRTFYEFLSLPKFGGETYGLITKLIKTDLTSSSTAVDGTQFGSHYLKSTRRYQRSW